MPGNAHASRHKLFTVGVVTLLILGSVSLLGCSSTPSEPSAPALSAFRAAGSPRLDEAGTNVVGAPYSAVGTRESVTRLLDGNRVVQKQVTRYYRDGQGRTRTESGLFSTSGNVASTGLFGSVSVTDPVSGEHYILNPQVKTVHAFPPLPEGFHKPPSVTPPVPAPTPLIHNAMDNSVMLYGASVSGPVADPKPLGEKTIRGVKAVGTRVKHTIAAGRMGNNRPITLTVDQWFSPQLGVVIESSSRSPTGHDSIYRLEQIELGEPDATLFQIPADYTRQEFNRGFGISRPTNIPGIKEVAPEKPTP